MRFTMFSARSYDRDSFEAANRKYGYEIIYREELLTADSANLAQGSDGICVFVNDCVDAAALDA